MTDGNSLKAITSEHAIDGVLRHFPKFFGTLGVRPQSAHKLVRRLVDLLREVSPQVLANVGSVLGEDRLGDRWSQALANSRAEHLAGWLAPHIRGTRILDLLCGDGSIGTQLAVTVAKEVTLVERTGQRGVVPRSWLPQIQDFDKFYRSADPGLFDTAILSTVLHHEVDPVGTLQLAVHCASRRVLIVENCIERNFHHDYHLLVDALFNRSLFSTTLACSGEHRTAEGWLRVCAQYGAARVVDRLEEVPGIPLAHTLIVIDLDCAR